MKKKPLLPVELIERSDKILFIAHLAIGDFTYLQNCFQAFSKTYPHLKIDLWVDEVRRTDDASKWPALKKYSLYDWLANCPFFRIVYDQTYSPALLEESVQKARLERYPIIVSLATLRPHLYAKLGRRVGPESYVIGMRKPIKWYQPQQLLAYRALDANIQPAGTDLPRTAHISDVYADWFYQLCGMHISPANRFPFVDIPSQWSDDAAILARQWRSEGDGMLVFINPFAKTRKRCWPLPRVAELIDAMQSEEKWRSATFIINAVPEELPNVRMMCEARSLKRVESFSAETNFFQLPAMLQVCDLIISVETAVMHLANAVKVPVIALMRQKNPEWSPLDRSRSTVITAKRRRDWVDAISVNDVMNVLP